jgi:hypothetical protein
VPPIPPEIRIAPYSYTLDEGAVAGLNAVARHLFGATTQLALRPSTEFGAEETAAAGMPRREDDVTLLLAVFNASSIPENENHGRFIETLSGASDTPLALLADLGPYRRRLGTQAGADQRLDERRRAWQAFARERGMPVACIDLAAPDLGRAEAEIAQALGGAA